MRYIILSLIISAAIFSSCFHEGNVTVEHTADSLFIDSLPERIEAVIVRELLFDKYTLADTFPYRDTVRLVQWDKIRKKISLLDSLRDTEASWGIIRNHRNKNGEALPPANFTRNEYSNIQDDYGVERYQGIPFYTSYSDSVAPKRYGLDGSLVKIFFTDSIFTSIEPIFTGGEWQVPSKYVKYIDADSSIFDRAIFVDRTNQYIITLQYADDKWLVRSVNPATTGLHKPPHQKQTPLGIFVVQEKKNKMFFWIDGTTEIGGFAPYASRFCNGGYIHGIPVNLPSKAMIEYSWSLGTTPRSHMCVRNATSHAKFIFDWAPVERSLVIVIE